MTRLAGNALAAVALLVGGAAIWLGLRALVLRQGDELHGPAALVAGFAVWIALAAVTRRASAGAPR